MNIPHHPTHAVHFKDNATGDGDRMFFFAFKIGDVFFDFDDGKPLLEYVGDEILNSWELLENGKPATPNTVTLSVAQLKEAMTLIYADDPDAIDDELTFGIVQHQEDWSGKPRIGLCCWNDDTEGVYPLEQGSPL